MDSFAAAPCRPVVAHGVFFYSRESVLSIKRAGSMQELKKACSIFILWGSRNQPCNADIGIAKKKNTPILEHLLPPSVGVSALHPRTSGYM
jgi:hypothetical protein